MTDPAARPPLVAYALLFALAGAAEAECVAGDLEEEYGLLRQSIGPAAAARWYVKQVLRSAGPLLELRIRTGELTQAMLLAALGIAAPLIALDRLWAFVYSNIPLKDGLERSPALWTVNAVVVVAAAILMGLALRRAPGAAPRNALSRVFALAFAIVIAAAISMWVSVGAAPALYAAVIALAAPAATFLSFSLKK
jgi:hypothetical protein